MFLRCRIQFQYKILFTTCALTSLGGDYGCGTMFNMYRKNSVIIFVWFGGMSYNYIYQQPAILWLQIYIYIYIKFTSFPLCPWKSFPLNSRLNCKNCEKVVSVQMHMQNARTHGPTCTLTRTF